MRVLTATLLLTALMAGCTPNAPVVPVARPQRQVILIAHDIEDRSLLCAETDKLDMDCITVGRFRAIANSVLAEP